MKKKLICALMTAAMAGSLVSGLTVSADSDSQVTISLYTTLPLSLIHISEPTRP